MKKLLLTIALFISCGTTSYITQQTLYSKNFSVSQFDSISIVDTLPSRANWDSIPIVNQDGNSFYIYVYSKSNTIYRVYLDKDSVNVTKRLNK